LETRPGAAILHEQTRRAIASCDGCFDRHLARHVDAAL
jgi:hypothetical protein